MTASAWRGLAAGVLALLTCAGAGAGPAHQPQAGEPAPLAQRERRPDGPLSPAEALASFELEPGYRIELAAAEPLVQDPVAMAFDEQGRLYVVESRGYPGPLEGESSSSSSTSSSAPSSTPGTIALLRDVDGDGRFDERTDFAVNLRYPNGVMPWNGGVFVSDAPDLLYLKDTTGDGIADERRVVLTGFDDKRTAQIRFSHPTLGLDNWVYLTSGLTGGQVTAPAHPDRPAVTIATSDSRFNPFTLAFELAGGNGQYGLTFDDYGRRFICSNRHPVLHVVLEPRYLQRNPHLAFSQTSHEVSAVGAKATVWPISADMTTASFHPTLMSAPHAGTFTAASGVHIHRGTALPAGQDDSIFICESAQNLVQRQVRSPSGVTFTSRPARTGREFLASRDSWFRPVFAANGPDGALYVVDMYRKTIDHPQYLPEQSRALFDFEAGKQRGRIYRIAAAGWRPDGTPVDLSRMSPEELARTLEHPNAWWRETAQRLLVERQERRAIPLLRTLVAEGRRDVARIHALWTLDGVGALQTADVVRALSDPQAAVRENGVRLAEARIATDAALLPHLLRLAGDPDDRVRLRTALALGDTADRRAVDALASIARRDGAQPWTRAAVLSSVGGRADEFLRVFAASPPPTPVRAAMMQDLAQVFGASQTPARCLDLILQISEPGGDLAWQPAALAGLARGLEARRLGSEDRSALLTVVSVDTPQAQRAKQRVMAIVQRSAALAWDDRAPAAQRLAAIDLLGHIDYPASGQPLLGLLAPQQSTEIQVAAARALARLPDRSAADSLVQTDRWLAFTPQVREAVLSELLADDRRTLVLLDALAAGRVAPATLGPARRTRLMSHRNPAIQGRARELLAAVTTGDRMQVYERLRGPVLARTGDAVRGEQIFAAACATCHAFAGTGGGVGPDLSGIGHQPPEAILLHVLVPDYEITPGYQSYVVETRDGRTHAGRLESEAPNSVTLRDAASRSQVILRSQIASMAASPSSLMPSELDRALPEQDLADLIAYLKRSR
jgi:putative membrane-bound dehydrogenase-like protein